MSAMRRATSSSQAAATDSSCVLSRLSMREPARSARSDTGRESAFFKRSAASWVMNLFYSEKAQLRQEAKNPYTCLWRIAELFEGDGGVRTPANFSRWQGEHNDTRGPEKLLEPGPLSRGSGCRTGAFLRTHTAAERSPGRVERSSPGRP